MQRAPGSLRAVIDTNVFVSGSISSVGASRRIVDLWREGRFTLIMGGEQHSELAEVLHRPAIKERYALIEDEVGALLFLVDVRAVRVAPRRRLPVTVRDPKDAHLLASALGGQADYLVTGDADLLVLEGDPRLGALRIVTPRAFLEVLEAQ